MKVNEMHFFSNLFDKVLYTFRTCTLSIIRSISTLDTRNRYLSCQFCWLPASRRQQNQHDKYLLRVYSVEILLMMDSGHIRNVQSTLSNKFEKQCTSLAFIIRIYYDARSSECQIHKYVLRTTKKLWCLLKREICLSHWSTSTQYPLLYINITPGSPSKSTYCN